MDMKNMIKGGSDLTKPKASVHWLISAVVAVIMLAIAVGIGLYLYTRGKKALKSTTAGVTSGLESQSSQQLQGFL